MFCFLNCSPVCLQVSGRFVCVRKHYTLMVCGHMFMCFQPLLATYFSTLFCIVCVLQITQIGLSVYKIICVGVFQAKGLSQLQTDIPFFISSLLVSR